MERTGTGKALGWGILCGCKQAISILDSDGYGVHVTSTHVDVLMNLISYSAPRYNTPPYLCRTYLAMYCRSLLSSTSIIPPLPYIPTTYPIQKDKVSAASDADRTGPDARVYWTEMGQLRMRHGELRTEMRKRRREGSGYIRDRHREQACVTLRGKHRNARSRLKTR